MLGGDQIEGELKGGLPQFLLGRLDARYRSATQVQRVEGERGPQLTDDVRLRIAHQIEQRTDRSLSITGTISPAKKNKQYQESYLPVIRNSQRQL